MRAEARGPPVDVFAGCSRVSASWPASHLPAAAVSQLPRKIASCQSAGGAQGCAPAAADWRRALRLMDTPPFSELGLPEPLLAAIKSLGFERPSPIQALPIPPALQGDDLIGLSQTGSGKTAAFSLPLLAGINLEDHFPQAIVLCPTRELANQVCEDVHRYASHMKGLRAVPVYGGAPIDRQFRALRQGAHVVVGTPGRESERTCPREPPERTLGDTQRLIEVVTLQFVVPIIQRRAKWNQLTGAIIEVSK